MGCSGSKTDDLPLVVRCRERRELIRAAASHRYALAAAHVSYFRSLKDVGDALRRFIDEELVAASASPSPPPITPSLSSEINGGESLHLHDDDEEEDSHLSISDSSTDDDGDFEDNRRHDVEKSSCNYSGKVYYMKKSAPPPTKTVVPAQPRRGCSHSYWNPAAGYGGDEGYFTIDSAKKTPPPPSPKASALGFLNVFDVFDGGYVGLYSSGDCEFPLNSSSFDSIEVREREGIPELEEETEHEVYRESLKGKRTNSPISRSTKNSSKSVPLRKNERRLTSEPLHYQNSSRSVLSWRSGDEGKKSPMPSERPSMSTPSSERKSRIEKSPKGDKGLTDETPRSVVSKSVNEGSMKKKGVHSELERRSNGDGGSSKLSSVTVLSPHGAKYIRDVVAEIGDDFEIASGYGKEVAMMLEAGKMPYQPSFLKGVVLAVHDWFVQFVSEVAILSRILYLTEPWLTIMDSSSIPSVIASRSVKLAKSYFEDVGKEFGAKVGSLSSTLDKLCAWETKLYKEVKDEEKLRMMYEEQRRRLKILEGVEAESAEVSSIRLLTKIDVCIKAIDVISSRIHKLRDEELQPKIVALIQGTIRMWKAMHRCHQKQFQAISESKMQNLRVKTGSQTNSSSSTITKLENELRAWHHHFNNWITFQKSYVESLNGWLLQFHHFDLEAAPYGPAPYSPGQLGAPPIFVICNDWHRAMEAISIRRLSNAMNTFASSLQNLWGKQDDEERQRLKAEHAAKNYEKLLRTHRVERQRMKNVGLSKLDLDHLRQRLVEERRKHKDATKLVQNAASSSLQGGLVTIFKELENFTLKALEAHQHIRLQHPVLHYR